MQTEVKRASSMVYLFQSNSHILAAITCMTLLAHHNTQYFIPSLIDPLEALGACDLM